MRVAGLVEATMLFGVHVRLTREIRSKLGSNTIENIDVVENLAFRSGPTGEGHRATFRAQTP